MDPKDKIIDAPVSAGVARKAPMPSATGRTAPLEPNAPTSYERPFAYQDWSRDPWRAASQWDYGQRSRGQQRRADRNSFWNCQR